MDPAHPDYATTVKLFPSGAAAAAHGLRDILEPNDDARTAIEKLVRLRGVDDTGMLGAGPASQDNVTTGRRRQGAACSSASPRSARGTRSSSGRRSSEPACWSWSSGSATARSTFAPTPPMSVVDARVAAVSESDESLDLIAWQRPGQLFSEDKLRESTTELKFGGTLDPCREGRLVHSWTLQAVLAEAGATVRCAGCHELRDAMTGRVIQHGTSRRIREADIAIAQEGLRGT